MTDIRTDFSSRQNYHNKTNLSNSNKFNGIQKSQKYLPYDPKILLLEPHRIRIFSSQALKVFVYFSSYACHHPGWHQKETLCHFLFCWCEYWNCRNCLNEYLRMTAAKKRKHIKFQYEILKTGTDKVFCEILCCNILKGSTILLYLFML